MSRLDLLRNAAPTRALVASRRRARCAALAPFAAPQDAPTPFARDNLLVTHLATGITETDFGGTLSRDVDSLSQGDTVAAPAFDPYGRLFVVNEIQAVVIAYDAAFHQLALFDGGNEVSTPVDVAFAPGGHLYVVDHGLGVVFELDVSDEVVQEIGATSGLEQPTAIAVGPNGLLYVAQTFDDEVFVFTPDGGLARRFGSGEITDPTALVIHDGALLVGTAADGILRFGLDGTALGTWAQPGDAPDVRDLSVGPDGRVWAALESSGEIVAFDASGAVAETRDVGGAPVGVCFVPWVFRAKLKGQRLGPESGLGKHVESEARLAWWPGSGRVGLGLFDGSPLVTDYGVYVWMLQGFEPTDPSAGKRRPVFGLDIGADLAAQGVGAVSGLVIGKPGDDGRLAAKKLKASVFKTNGSAAFLGALQTKGKPLN